MSLIPTGVFRVSSPALSTHLSMPLRGPGSTQAQSLCFMAPSLLSTGGHSVPLVSATPLDPGGAPTAVPTLGDGAHRQDLAPGRDLSTSRPVHAALQTWSLSYMWGSLSHMLGSLSHMSGSLSHMWGPNRHGAGPFQLSAGPEASPGVGLSTAVVTVTQSPNRSKNCSCLPAFQGFHHGSDSEESACNSGALGSMSESGRFLGERNGYPLQYSCLENYMDKGAWQATVHGVSKRWT